MHGYNPLNPFNPGAAGQLYPAGQQPPYIQPPAANQPTVRVGQQQNQQPQQWRPPSQVQKSWVPAAMTAVGALGTLGAVCLSFMGVAAPIVVGVYLFAGAYPFWYGLTNTQVVRKLLFE